MNHTTRIVPSPVLVGVLVLAAVALAPSYAVWTTVPGHPAVIAGVDLERVFNEINVRADREIELEELNVRLRKTRETLRREADRLKQDLVELYAVGSDEYKKAEKKWKNKVIEYQATVEFSRAKLLAAQTEARKKIYQAIIGAANALASANGIDFIISDDSVIDLQDGNDLQIVQQMSLRRVVYANPELDVTNDLIAWINEQ